jgi:hypothetical protein
MPKLSFLAVEGAKVRHPYQANTNGEVAGHPPRYIGWKRENGAWVLDEQPTEIENDGSAKVRALCNEVRRDKCLKPVDSYTASECGMPDPTPSPKKKQAAPSAPATSAQTPATVAAKGDS